MRTVPVVVFLVFCLACENEPMPVAPVPVREDHYNFETGEKVGETTLEYNSKGKLVSEYFASTVDIGDNEVLYEYDNKGQLIRKKQRQPKVTDEYYIIEFGYYEDGSKKSETNFHSNNPIGYQYLYFYSNNRLDSMQMSAYSSTDQKYISTGSIHYDYDSENRIIQELGDWGGETLYHYDGLMVSKCHQYHGYDGIVREFCTDEEYSSAGQLITITLHYPNFSQLQEEFFYEEGRLVEKRVYSYPGYSPGNTVDIRQIKYVY